MGNQAKSIKSAAKEAKMRLKNRFWQDYKKEMESEKQKASDDGLQPSVIEKYYRAQVVRSVRGRTEEDESFYDDVRSMLDRCGRPSDALDRLMDKEYFASLSYMERERYLLRLSEKYLAAVERYDEERGVERYIRGE